MTCQSFVTLCLYGKRTRIHMSRVSRPASIEPVFKACFKYACNNSLKVYSKTWIGHLNKIIYSKVVNTIGFTANVTTFNTVMNQLNLCIN